MADLVFYHGLYSGQQIDSAVARALSGGALDQEIAALRSAVGSPLVATTVAQMTNTNKIYVYTGSQAGYSFGHWYYWSGSAWTDGGVYNAVVVDMAMSGSSNNAVANKVITAAIRNALTTAKETAYDAYPTETDSGAQAVTMVGAKTIPLKAITVQVVATQSGSGDPAPDNVRPINGWTNARIRVETTGGIAGAVPVEWLSAGECFGGVLSYNGASSWTLIVTHYVVNVGGLTWTDTSASHVFKSNQIQGDNAIDITPANPVMCDTYASEPYSTTIADMENNTIKRGNTLANVRQSIYIRDDRFDKAAAFAEAMSSVRIVYPLETEKSFQVEALGVYSYLGENTVSANTGDVDVTFRCDPTLYIDSKIAALTALISEI